MTAGSKASQNYNVQDIVGAMDLGVFESQGYVITTGLSFLSGSEPFTLSLNNTNIDFGDLTPNQPKISSVKMIVANGNSAGYKILVGETKALTSLGGAVIKDTACDDPQKPCTVKSAYPWIKDSAFGFGYGATGRAIVKDFKDTSYYRPFANLSNGIDSQVLAQTEAFNVTDQAFINFKVNVSRSQPIGKYQNSISFMAIPGY